MKKYEKPMLMVLNLNGNDQLCGSCADKGGQLLSQNPGGYPANALDLLVAAEGKGDGNGVLTREEAAQVFGEADGCDIYLDAYCKFQSVGANVVAWS